LSRCKRGNAKAYPLKGIPPAAAAVFFATGVMYPAWNDKSSRIFKKIKIF
jgi:hypothetical protein